MTDTVEKLRDEVRLLLNKRMGLELVLRKTNKGINEVRKLLIVKRKELSDIRNECKIEASVKHNKKLKADIKELKEKTCRYLSSRGITHQEIDAMLGLSQGSSRRHTERNNKTYQG